MNNLPAGPFSDSGQSVRDIQNQHAAVAFYARGDQVIADFQLSDVPARPFALPSGHSSFALHYVDARRQPFSAADHWKDVLQSRPVRRHLSRAMASFCLNSNVWMPSLTFQRRLANVRLSSISWLPDGTFSPAADHWDDVLHSPSVRRHPLTPQEPTR